MRSYAPRLNSHLYPWSINAPDMPKGSIPRYLEEDIGRGDVTSLAICRGERVRGKIMAKGDFVVCGVEEAREIFYALGVRKMKVIKKDGSRAKKGDVILELEGDAQAVLAGERTALNILMRMSGIATMTRSIQDRVSRANPKARVAATRKTTPGFREYEKRAVVVGGGRPHRSGLFDAVLIKDNHIRIAGGVAEAVERVREAMRRGNIKKGRIEVEAQSIDEVKEAVRVRADTIMLDNFTPEMAMKARKIIPSGILVEISGGVNGSNAAEYAPHADLISMGALTHSYKSVDVSLEIEKVFKPERRRSSRSP